jgi:RNA polymerase sigma factor (sigma-70 family)
MGTIAKTDAQLVEASRRGELEAFGHLVARYQDVVCAVGYSATGDRGLGEDVAQDTFLAAWRQLDRVRDAMRIGPWLCGIARNLGRKARRRTRREQLGDAPDHAAAAPSAFDQLVGRDAERVVRDALARVPESYREVLVLYYRDDHTVREVAAALGVSEDAVMQRLSRGRRYLADSVTALVERSLRDTRPRRDLVAAVVAAIAAFAIPSRVDASPLEAKGSTMLKLTLAAATAIAVVGTTAYLVHDRDDASQPAVAARTGPHLHYGAGPARVPALGPTAPRHATAARRAAVDDLGWLPADSQVVFGIDMTRIQTSALWQTFVAPTLEHASGIDEFATACGFDPLASLTLVTFGLSGFGVGNDNVAGTVVFHGFDKTKVMACVVDHAVPDAQANGVNITVDGDVVIVNGHGADSAVGLTFVDDTTGLIVIGPAAATKAGIEQVAAGHGALASSPQFAEMFTDIDSDDPLWFVATPGSPVFAGINEALAPYTSLQVAAAYGSIDITSSLTVQAGLQLASADQAAKLVGDIHTQVDQLAGTAGVSQYFDQLDVDADATDVIIDMSASAPQLMSLAATLSARPTASITPAGSNGTGEFSVGVTIGAD